MFETIQNKLDEIEEKENVRIIHCVESGSRAWGFASPDSDYDVRFIYVRPEEYYLRLDKTRDVIEWQLDDTLDINGWDIQKTLILLRKSNPTVFEWNASPIVYRTTDEWAKVSVVINNYFAKKAGLYHYLSTAKGNYKAYFSSDEVKYKKYFYVLRPLLACRWILDRGTPPPMLFSELVELYLEDGMKPTVQRLLEIKTKTPEAGTGKPINELNEYLLENIESVSAQISSLPGEKEGGWEELNGLFLDMVRG